MIYNGMTKEGCIVDLRVLSRWGHRIPVEWLFHRVPKPVYRLTALVLAVMVFASLVVYGVTVMFENQIVDLGRTTRDLHEDNQDLQIRLDRLRSYQQVAKASEKIHGLKVATTVIDVVERPLRLQVKNTPPVRPLPKETYGF